MPDWPRVTVRKSYRLYVGGAFPPSESGRTYLVAGTSVALASGNDLRNAVAAARAAGPGWAGGAAYLRGRLLYRVAELLEGRTAELAELGVAPAEVGAAVDRWVWYAGWADKLAQVVGGANPVVGPLFNVSTPEPVGVVGIVAPAEAPLLGLVSVVAPVIVGGNTVVVLAAHDHPRPAITLAEVLATAELPPGVVNVLTGQVSELVRGLAGHPDVDALDLTGVADPELGGSLERTAAGQLTRVLRPPTAVDWNAAPGLARMTAFLETKTIWHPRGI